MFDRSSAYLVFVSVKKANDKNLFDHNNPELDCPVKKGESKF